MDDKNTKINLFNDSSILFFISPQFLKKFGFLFFFISLCFQNAKALEVQFGSKQKETIRFTEVPFKKKTFVHVEYLKGWRVLNEYVLDEEKSKIYQQEFKRLARKNKKFDQIADDECKTKIRMRDQMNRQFLCYEKWSEQDKKSFKTWTSFVQKDLFKNKKIKGSLN